MKYTAAIQGWPRKLLRIPQLIAHWMGWRTLDERIAMLIRLGYWPHLKHPRTFNEHLSHRKLYDHNPIFAQIADKVGVRSYVADRLGERFLIPALGVYDDPDQIPWDALPDSFVVKTNHRSGGNLLVSRKADLDLYQAKQQLRAWFDEPYGQEKYEWFYGAFPRKILVEQFLVDPVEGVPPDYKLYTFHGRVEFIHVDRGRFGEHERSFYDRNWRRQEFSVRVPASGTVDRPANLDEMLNVAEVLAGSLDFVRVDLFSVEGRIYVGEMTLAPSSGRKRFYPDHSFDFLLGSFWK